MKKLINLIFAGLFILTIDAQQVDFDQVKLISGPVNSEYEESKPIISPDGKMLYFVRSQKNGNTTTQEIWYSFKKNDNEWSTPTSFTAFNEMKHNAVIGISEDGKRLYLMNYYSNKGPRQTGISYSFYHPDSLWMRPKPINLPVIENFGKYNDYYLTPDESILLISMKTYGSIGQEDLYVCLKQADGSWQGPINLGANVNTKGYEISPFLAEDKKTLFFSSNGRKDGKGNADIYYTQRLDYSWTNWSTPVNLGDKINSEGFDAYFSISPQRDILFASTKNETTSQLYTGKIIGNLGEDPLKSINGYMSECGDLCEELAKLRSRIEELENQNKLNLDSYNERNLEYIYFDFDSYVLSEESKKTLDHVAEFLLKHPNYRVMFVGHTDSKGHENYNLKLSEKRCLAAEDYLESKGISETRIYNKSYGKQKLLDESGDPNDHELNRRVEIFFLK